MWGVSWATGFSKTILSLSKQLHYAETIPYILGWVFFLCIALHSSKKRDVAADRTAIL